MNNFKNWNAITDLGKVSPLLMMAVATINPNRPQSQPVLVAFPHCFNQVADMGKVPLSAILTKAEQSEYRSRSGRLLPSIEAIPLHVPVMELRYEGSTLDDIRHVLPNTISRDVSVGDVIALFHQLFIVLENNDNDGCKYVTVAPAECVLVEC